MSARAEAGARRLDHDLVAPAAQRCVVRAERPYLAVPIGHDRHLEVAGAGEQRLEVQRGVAEPRLRIGRGLVDDREQLSRTVDAPDADSPSAGGGLEHHGEPERGGRLDGRVWTIERAPVPRHDRQAGALGTQLDGDPVTHAAKHIGIGTQEPDADVVADGGGGRILGRRCHPGHNVSTSAESSARARASGPASGSATTESAARTTASLRPGS